MAVGHVGYNIHLPHGQLLKKSVDDFANGLDTLNELFLTIGQMRDGDGSQASHFDYAVEKFGFDDNVAAKACFDELGSVLAKLNTDASTSSVASAISQFIAKLLN